jgi:2'-5' RNA ligase
MAVKRLFIGTILPPNIVGNHMEELKSSFADVCTGKWVEDYNAHLNYKFLGNVEEERIPEIKEALNPVLKKYNVPLYINNLSCYPAPDRPRVLLANIFSPGKNVHAIFSKVEEITTKKLDFPKERTKFTPHITLCRLKTTTEDFAEKLTELEEYKIGFLKFYRVNLIASTLTPTGPKYEIL